MRPHLDALGCVFDDIESVREQISLGASSKTGHWISKTGNGGRNTMAEIATIFTSIGTLAVAVGALIVSVGVFTLVVRVGRAVERMVDNDRNDSP